MSISAMALLALGGAVLAQPFMPGIDTLSRDLAKARKASGSSCQQYVWRAYHLVRTAFEAAAWTAAQESLLSQGAEIKLLTKRRAGAPSRTFSCQFPELSFALTGGKPFKLRIELQVFSPKPEERPPLLEEVEVREVSLVAQPDLPLSLVREQGVFSPESVIGRALKTKQASAASEYAEVLDEVRLSYDQHPWPGSVLIVGPPPKFAFGFDVSLHFRNRIGLVRNRVLLWADSGLDAPRSHLPYTQNPPDFEPKDTFGELRDPFARTGSRLGR